MSFIHIIDYSTNKNDLEQQNQLLNLGCAFNENCDNFPPGPSYIYPKNNISGFSKLKKFIEQENQKNKTKKITNIKNNFELSHRYIELEARYNILAQEQEKIKKKLRKNLIFI